MRHLGKARTTRAPQAKTPRKATVPVELVLEGAGFLQAPPLARQPPSGIGLNESAVGTSLIPTLRCHLLLELPGVSQAEGFRAPGLTLHHSNVLRVVLRENHLSILSGFVHS
jgi:hypothetical protein